MRAAVVTVQAQPCSTGFGNARVHAKAMINPFCLCLFGTKAGQKLDFCSIVVRSPPGGNVEPGIDILERGAAATVAAAIVPRGQMCCPSCNSTEITLCRFYTPEELSCGRLESHGGREVFESNLSDENEIACVRCPQFLSPSDEKWVACGPSPRTRLDWNENGCVKFSSDDCPAHAHTSCSTPSWRGGNLHAKRRDACHS